MHTNPGLVVRMCKYNNKLEYEPRYISWDNIIIRNILVIPMTPGYISVQAAMLTKSNEFVKWLVVHTQKESAGLKRSCNRVFMVLPWASTFDPKS